MRGTKVNLNVLAPNIGSRSTILEVRFRNQITTYKFQKQSFLIRFFAGVAKLFLHPIFFNPIYPFDGKRWLNKKIEQFE